MCAVSGLRNFRQRIQSPTVAGRSIRGGVIPLGGFIEITGKQLAVIARGHDTQANVQPIYAKVLIGDRRGQR